MPDEEFELHKTALATKKLEKPKQLSKLTGRFWKEISSRHYNFDRVELEVKELRSLQKNHILSFYEVTIFSSYKFEFGQKNSIYFNRTSFLLFYSGIGKQMFLQTTQIINSRRIRSDKSRSTERY